MNTPPRPDARERILDAADRLFYRDGVRAVGVDTVIAEAGVAKMTLYAHFKSKDELIVAYLNRRDERVTAWFADAVERHAARTGDRFGAVFDALKEWFESPDFRGCAFVNGAVQFADPTHPGFAVIAAHKRKFRDFLEATLRSAGVRGPAEAADRLMLLVDGATVAAVVRQSSTPADEARAAAGQMIGKRR